jgi:hypothetical protein
VNGGYERPGKVVCWKISASALGRSLPSCRKEAEFLTLAFPSEPEQLLTELGTPGDAILLVDGLAPLSVELIRNFHEQAEWKGLPVFAPMQGADITGDMRALASDLRVELLPLPAAEKSFWGHLLEACHQYHVQRDKTRANLRLRRHKRVALSLTAHCSVDAQTVDISAGGMQFHTNHLFFPGDRGEIDVPAIKDNIGRSLPFEVVKAETQRGDFQFLVRARFVGLDDGILQKLIQTLNILEPDAGEA